MAKINQIPEFNAFSEEFPVKAPEYFNFAYDVVDRWAQTDRNKQAMLWTNQQGEERRFTFFDLSRLSNQAANLLMKHGVTTGDRVFLMLPRIPEWWILSLGMIKLGAVQCPSPSLLTAQDIEQRINFGGFKVVISDVDNADKFDAVFDKCPSLTTRILVNGERPGWISYDREMADNQTLTLARHEVKSAFKIRTKSTDPLLILFTSGTSKHPKMVLHNHAYPLAHMITAKLWHGLTANDLHVTVSDTGWGKNLWGNYFGQWIVGACVLIFDIRGKFHAEELLPVLEKYAVTSFCAPPTVYRMLTLIDLRKFDFRYLRNCTVAGEPMPSETVRLWKDGTGLTTREGYGQTETVCAIANFAGMENRIGSIGKPAPGWEIELHDEDGNAVPPGEEGRIAVKVKDGAPVGLFEKYLYSEDETAACFSNGYYYTGDRAKCDADGYYYFVGRSDDIIKSSGYRIGPMEVEDTIMHHPAVFEAGVVGAPDPLRGMRVKAYIVLKPGFAPTESLVKDIQNFVKKETAPYKYPRELEFVRCLPKTISGKIKHDLLRHHAQTGEMLWDDAGNAKK